MTAIGRLEFAGFDAADIETLASFYAELAGWQIVRKDSGWIIVRAGDGQEVGFQHVPEHVPPQWPGHGLGAVVGEAARCRGQPGRGRCRARGFGAAVAGGGLSSRT